MNIWKLGNGEKCGWSVIVSFVIRIEKGVLFFFIQENIGVVVVKIYVYFLVVIYIEGMYFSVCVEVIEKLGKFVF